MENFPKITGPFLANLVILRGFCFLPNKGAECLNTLSIFPTQLLFVFCFIRCSTFFQIYSVWLLYYELVVWRLYYFLVSPLQTGDSSVIHVAWLLLFLLLSYQSGRHYQTCCKQPAVGCFESVDVWRVLDKGVDYIREVCRLNPLQYSYTTIKRFSACLQMFSPFFLPWHESDPVP